MEHWVFPVLFFLAGKSVLQFMISLNCGTSYFDIKDVLLAGTEGSKIERW